MHSLRLIGLVFFSGVALGKAPPLPADMQMPRYAHIFVIMEENKDYAQIIGSPNAPAINALAHKYGIATQFFAETHPSQPNYVALIGGYTYGIYDDDAYYCKPADERPSCSHSAGAGYVSHTVEAPNLATQLEAAHLSWKNYNESIPGPGSLAVTAADPHSPDLPPTLQVYASKHSGFMNFASVQRDPQRAKHIVGFGQLHSDLRTGAVPSFSFVIPNLCNEMHGAGDPQTPADCRYANLAQLIARGDRHTAALVAEITGSAVWHASGNAAIVIAFDEDSHGGTEGCCGVSAGDPANAGGGHIAVVVLTNHGPRAVADSTHYSHYSLLRTIEDAFGIHTYLRQAGAPGVVPMTPLFKISR